MTAGTPARCAVHPARPAVDTCPVCDRPRCAADAAESGAAGCPACRTPDGASRRRPAGPLELVVRAALAALAAAVVGGAVAAQYVDAEVFAYLTPVVVGAGCGAAAQAASGTARGAAARTPTATRVRVVAAVAAVLAVGLGFLLEGSREPLSGHALAPSLLAVAGAVLWTLPPRGPATAPSPR